MRTHMSIDIAKAIKWSDQDLGLFTDKETGKHMPPEKVRQLLRSYLAEGKEKFPCGDCDNFDYKTGCLGHP